MAGSESMSIGIAVAALLSGVMTLGLNLRRQRTDRHAGRTPKRSGRITFGIEVVLLAAIAGALVWTLLA